MKQTGCFLIILTFILVACKEMTNVEGTVVGLATVLPTTTEIATKIAAATPTLPSSTPTLRLPSPTISPTITHTPVPTLIPATPFPSPANYSLKPWSEQEALNVIVLLEGKWQQFNAID